MNLAHSNISYIRESDFFSCRTHKDAHSFLDLSGPLKLIKQNFKKRNVGFNHQHAYYGKSEFKPNPL
jgi:hypothetical protein